MKVITTVSYQKVADQKECNFLHNMAHHIAIPLQQLLDDILSGKLHFATELPARYPDLTCVRMVQGRKFGFRRQAFL
jgi:hypothetical protein